MLGVVLTLSVIGIVVVAVESGSTRSPRVAARRGSPGLGALPSVRRGYKHHLDGAGSGFARSPCRFRSG